MENNKNLKMLARELDGWRSESPQSGVRCRHGFGPKRHPLQAVWG